MRINPYTKAVDNIKAPEAAVEKMVRTTRGAADKREAFVMKKTVFKIAACAAAAVIVIGVIFAVKLLPSKTEPIQPEPQTGSAVESEVESAAEKTEPAFMIKVSAEEVTHDKPIEFTSGGDQGVGYSYNPSTGIIEYYLQFADLECTGEDIESVTYTPEHDHIGVRCLKDDNPILGGEVTEGIDVYDPFNPAPNDSIVFNPSYLWSEDLGSDPLSSWDKYYTMLFDSITIDYNNQNPDYFNLQLFGAKEPNFGPDFDPNFGPDGISLHVYEGSDPTEMEALVSELFDNRLACTVNYTDGTTATQYLAIHAEYQIDEAYHEDKDDDEDDRWDLRFTCTLE